MSRHRSNGWGSTYGAGRGGQRATSRTERWNISSGSRDQTPADVLAAARWMHFHEIALMPARRRGGEQEVRYVLQKARADGLISMDDTQLEQEVRDVMAAPDVAG